MKGAKHLKKKYHAETAESIAERFDLPAGIVSGLPRIEIKGGRQVTIEQHKGLIEYSRGEIAVNTAKSILRIRGDGLEIRAMTSEILLITGNIHCVEF